MGGLKDQLLKAGLVNAKQVKQAQQQQRKQAHQQLKQGDKEEVKDEKRLHEAAQAAKAERDRQLNRERQTAAQQKALCAEIRQLIGAHRKSDWQGEVPFNFQDGTTVKRLHVTDAIRLQLVRGSVAIVHWERRYEIIPADVAQKIESRNASVIRFRQSREEEPPTPTDDDPYAGFEVPDDLLW